MKTKYKIIFWAIVAVVIFFRIWGLSTNDLATDDALYSFRSLGWLDYIGGGQTTPIQWFGHVPWWGNLSFHDAPPLVFFIQHAFFGVFGANALAARLPFALAGIGVCLLIYFIFKLCQGEKPALVAFWLVAISSYQIWISRVGFLEGIETFFIVLSILCLLLYLQPGRARKYLLWWGVAVGLSLLSKYTAIFIIPSALIYFLIWERSIFKSKNFWLAVGATLMVLLPVIIYNIGVFTTRGHFDAAISTFVGMHPQDFSGLSRSVSHDYIGNFVEEWRILYRATSLPMFALLIFGFAWLIYKVIRKRGDVLDRILVLNTIVAMIMFLFIAPANRFLPIVAPFLIGMTAIAVIDLATLLTTKRKYLLVIIITIVALVCLAEIGYAYNTNITNSPSGRAGIHYSNDRFYNHGFNQLDAYIQDKIFNPLASKNKVRNLEDLKNNFANIRGKNVVFYDESLDWFAYSWYLQKYVFYYGYPIMSMWSYLQSVPKDMDALLPLKRAEVKGFYYIYGSSDLVLDSVKKNTPIRDAMSSFAKQLEGAGYGPGEIKDARGHVAFKFYYVQFK